MLTEFEASEAYNLVVIGASEQRAPPAAYYSPRFVPTRLIGMPDASYSGPPHAHELAPPPPAARNGKRRADAEPVEVEASSSGGSDYLIGGSVKRGRPVG